MSFPLLDGIQWPLSIHLPPPFALSLLILLLTFHLLSPRYPTPKQTSWIVTTFSSLIMSLASIPFIYTYLHNGVEHIHEVYPQLAWGAARFFQGYLLSDLALGVVFYRSQVSFVEGWMHHLVYICIVQVALGRGWAGVFCLGAFMEIPTFILGISILHPNLRNNILFATAFFAIRIMFHLVLTFSYFQRGNREAVGSYVPAAVLACIFPIHAWWFYNCILGFLRRWKAGVGEEEQKRRDEVVDVVIELEIYHAQSDAGGGPDSDSRSAVSGARQARDGSEIGGNGKLKPGLGRVSSKEIGIIEGGLGHVAGNSPKERGRSLWEVVFNFVGLGTGGK